MDTIDTTMYTISQGIVPTGTLLDFAGAAAPTGYVLCYGQAIDRTTYATLFAVVGTTYGIGDGSTTFNVPDFRGRVAAGKDNMGGSAANRITNAVSGITATNLGAVGGDQNSQSHTHTATVTDAGHLHLPQSPSSVFVAAGGAASGAAIGSGGVVTDVNTTTSTATTGITVSNSTYGSGVAQNIQPTIIINKIIKT